MGNGTYWRRGGRENGCYVIGMKKSYLRKKKNFFPALRITPCLIRVACGGREVSLAVAAQHGWPENVGGTCGARGQLQMFACSWG